MAARNSASPMAQDTRPGLIVIQPMANLMKANAVTIWMKKARKLKICLELENLSISSFGNFSVDIVNALFKRNST